MSILVEAGELIRKHARWAMVDGDCSTAVEERLLSRIGEASLTSDFDNKIAAKALSSRQTGSTGGKRSVCYRVNPVGYRGCGSRSELG